MNINLLQNLSEKNKLNKNFSVLSTINSVLKKESSIINPTLIINFDSSITESNYIYIPEFRRYYFITDIVSVNNNLWELSCTVDVLSSFSTQIKAQTAVIKRQENLWNLYLDDGIFKTYQNPNIITKKFPSGFQHSTFILAVAGG